MPQSDRIVKLEEALADYAMRYGLTPLAREVMVQVPDPRELRLGKRCSHGTRLEEGQGPAWCIPSQAGCAPATCSGRTPALRKKILSYFKP